MLSSKGWRHSIPHNELFILLEALRIWVLVCIPDTKQHQEGSRTVHRFPTPSSSAGENTLPT